MSELNESVTFTVGSSTTLSVPVDTTLSIEGQAADAAAVGRALAQKQDAGSVVISVNGQVQDNQGQIEITGEDIPVDETEGAESIADAVAALQERTGADIPVSGSEAETISAKLGTLQDAVGNVEQAVTGLTADGIVYDGTAQTPQSIKAKVDAVAQSVETVGGKTAADIIYDGTAQTPQSIKAVVEAIRTQAEQGGTENVKYTAQTLTAEQQLQVRNNINAADKENLVDLMTAHQNKWSDVIPYNVMDLSSVYPLPCVDAGYATRMDNACHLFRFGPIVIVSFAFTVNSEMPAGTRVVGFYTGLEAASLMHCASQMVASDGTSVYALYRDGEGMAVSLAVPAGFYRGFIIYGLNSTLWPVST